MTATRETLIPGTRVHPITNDAIQGTVIGPGRASLNEVRVEWDDERGDHIVRHIAADRLVIIGGQSS